MHVAEVYQPRPSHRIEAENSSFLTDNVSFTGSSCKEDLFLPLDTLLVMKLFLGALLTIQLLLE